MRVYRNLYLLPKFLANPATRPPPRSLEHLLCVDSFRRNSSNSVSNAFGGSTPISYENAMSAVKQLNAQERDALRQALSKFESAQLVSHQLEGELAAGRWQSVHHKHGGHSAITVDAKVAEVVASSAAGTDQQKDATVEQPSRADLRQLMIVNSVPFIGFGFLDNFFMIIAGDYIESTLGVYMCISTMAAAGLGNTISDVMGLGLAHYVEQFCVFMGMRPPQLTPEQIDGKACRRVMSYGRALGITIGCIIGMFPLYFMNKKPKPKPSEPAANNAAVVG